VVRCIVPFLFWKLFEVLRLGSYRGRLDIIADILQVAIPDAKKTQIMYQANLSYKVLQRYLKEILSASLLCFADKKQCYVITEKGREYLAAYVKYARTSRSIQRQMNDVEEKKRLLENLCSEKKQCVEDVGRTSMLSV
jgi:predicted transcriptional regulator